MNTSNFEKLLLKTAFSCMACDGDIDKNEMKLIKQLHEKKSLFGDIDIDDELEALLIDINKDGHKFMKEFFDELKVHDFTDNEELQIIETSLSIIKSDDKIDYSEIKFFKVIKSNLTISNYKILETHPDFEEYLEEDIITESYLKKIQDDFFDTHIDIELSCISEKDIIDTNPKKI